MAATVTVTRMAMPTLTALYRTAEVKVPTVHNPALTPDSGLPDDLIFIIFGSIAGVIFFTVSLVVLFQCYAAHRLAARETWEKQAPYNEIPIDSKAGLKYYIYEAKNYFNDLSELLGSTIGDDKMNNVYAPVGKKLTINIDSANIEYAKRTSRASMYISPLTELMAQTSPLFSSGFPEIPITPVLSKDLGNYHSHLTKEKAYRLSVLSIRNQNDSERKEPVQPLCRLDDIIDSKDIVTQAEVEEEERRKKEFEQQREIARRLASERLKQMTQSVDQSEKLNNRKENTKKRVSQRSTKDSTEVKQFLSSPPSVPQKHNVQIVPVRTSSKKSSRAPKRISDTRMLSNIDTQLTLARISSRTTTDYGGHRNTSLPYPEDDPQKHHHRNYNHRVSSSHIIGSEVPYPISDTSSVTSPSSSKCISLPYPTENPTYTKLLPPSERRATHGLKLQPPPYDDYDLV